MISRSFLRAVRGAVALPLVLATFTGVSTVWAQEVGVPWVGAPGITETIEQIMARPGVAEEYDDGEIVEGDNESELPYPDRSMLPQDPESPEVSQWPPLPRSGGNDEELGGVLTPHHVPPKNPQTVSTSFLGAQLSESSAVPPDSQGDVGPTQVLICVNNRIKVFDKSGVLGALNASTNSFFTSVRNGSGTSDPRVRYDRLTQRWFVSILNLATPNRILLAVSSGPTITGTSSFTFYFFQHDTVGTTPNSDTGGFADYDTLGVDANAVYLGANIFNAAGTAFLGTTGYVVRKTSVLSGGPIVVTAFRQLATSSGAGPFSPAGPDNDDAAATEGYFVGLDNATLGRITLRRVANPGATPSISSNITLTVPSTALSSSVPCQGSTGNLDSLDDRHYTAKIHLDRISGVRTLWMSHNIKVNSSGVGTSGGDRNGSRWYQIGTLTGTPTLVQSGTLFDNAASSPRNFWIPSAVMSGQGHMAIGSSAAGLAERAEIAVAGRFRTDALGSTQAPTTAVTTSTNYNVQSGTQRWGDYSHTSVDPNDDQTMWTFQEYCNGTNSWAVRAVKLLAPPPATPSACNPASVSAGLSNVNVIVTGTSINGSEFYDTDASYTQRLVAAVGGTGVTVNSVSWTGPTQFTMNISVTAGATPSARTVTVTNPDGQSTASASGILTITNGCTSPGITSNPNGQTVCAGTGASFTVVASGSNPLSYQWRKNTVNIGGATNATYSIPSTVTGDSGSYDCVVTNNCGNATCNAATLTVNGNPSFTQQPANQTVNVGDSATFTVAVQGQFFNFTYQWRRNGSNLSDGGTISGSSSPSMTIDPVGLSDAGNYDCVVASIASGCSSTSNVGVLTVNSAPCFGDLNGDNNVGLPDLSILLAHYGLTPATYLDGDLDGNNVVDLSDLSIMLSLYGTTCP